MVEAGAKDMKGQRKGNKRALNKEKRKKRRKWR